MNCPSCNEKMEREDCLVEGAPNTPASHYHCPECDAEYLWVKGRRGLQILEAPNVDIFNLIKNSYEMLSDLPDPDVAEEEFSEI